LMFRAIVQGWLSAWLARRDAGVRHPLKPLEPSQPETDGAPAADHGKVDPEIDAMHGEAAPKPADPGLDPKRRNFWPAVVLTSLFFGILHMPQWPAPISIFVLSLALGAVYQRTGSLIAAIFMHATFNGLSTLAAIGAILASQGAPVKREEKIPSKITIERIESVALGRQWVIKANGKD
jgi:hypothetical protein